MKVTLVSHVMLTGCNHSLQSYLVPRVDSVLAIEHPLENKPGSKSTYKLETAGVVGAKGSKSTRLPEVVRFFKDFGLTLYWSIRLQPRADLFVGLDPLNAFAGLLLRRLRLVKYVVFYAIDFSPKRFNNPLINFIYHLVEVLCARWCDESWNLNVKMIEARRALPGIAKLLSKPRGAQRVVPMGANPVDKMGLATRDPHRLGFLGWLVEKQGLQLAIEAMPKLLKLYPNCQLEVIGEGPYEPFLQKRIEDLGISQSIHFHGYVEDHQSVERILAGCAIGLAPYLPIPDSFTFFTDPGKIKNYLAAHLPVITTRVPPISREIEQRRAGIVVDPDPNAVAAAVLQLFSDPKELDEMTANAANYARRFYWDSIFEEALEPFMSATSETENA